MKKVENSILRSMIEKEELKTGEDLFDFLEIPQDMRSDFVLACFMKNIFQMNENDIEASEFMNEQKSKLDNLNQTIEDFNKITR